MEINQLLKNYYETREKHIRKVGRYNSSELYNIISGDLKPENFLKEKKFTLESYRNMFEGEVREQALKTLLDASEIEYEYQVKDVLKKDDFEIVCVADFLLPNCVFECKFCNVFQGIKPYHSYQLEIQYRVFKKPVYVGYFQQKMANMIYKYEPSDKLYNFILEKVGEFHKKVVKN